MFAPFALVANLASEVFLSLASPAQRPLAPSTSYHRFFDVQVRRDRFPASFYVLICVVHRGQAHRGGRGNTIENTLPSFAWCVRCGSAGAECECAYRR